ncbi:hypothetical protein C5S31_09835 [ANME-1 cluster archaeon GoMg2]|nr:hypothetical protein [ANME-1 cluster archaeon GoMg2]
MRKCHADIEDEMTSGENCVHRDLTCAMCPRTGPRRWFLLSYGTGRAICTNCHERCLDINGKVYYDRIPAIRLWGR